MKDYKSEKYRCLWKLESEEANDLALSQHNNIKQDIQKEYDVQVTFTFDVDPKGTSNLFPV